MRTSRTFSIRWINGLIFLATMFISCDNNQEIASNDKQNSISASDFKSSKAEEAFPGKKGEVVKFNLNNEDIFVEKFGDEYVFMGDIILSKEQVAILKGGKNARTAIADFVKHWGGGVVYYTISSALPNPERVINAINHWKSVTSIDFQIRTNQSDYIEFVVGSGCSSSYGRTGGRQTINLGTGCERGEVIHEIGHAIGFFHEQARTDRGNSIIINTQNIEDGKEHNFKTYAELGLSGFQFGAFDFESIMMYSSWDFSRNFLPTMERVDHSFFLAQRQGLSPGDIETVNAIYGAPYVKLRQVETDFSEIAYTNFYQWSRTIEYYLDFYSDSQCTVPFTGSANKLVNYRLHTNRVVNGGVYQYSYTDHRILIQPNQNSIALGSFESNELNDWGELKYGVNYQMEILSPNGR